MSHRRGGSFGAFGANAPNGDDSDANESNAFQSISFADGGRQLPVRPTLLTFRSPSIDASRATPPAPSFDSFGRYSGLSTPSTSMESPPIGTASADASESRRPKAGILRLDMSKPRRSSGGSVEFRAHPQMLGEDSGLTSPHQLSVTWAESCDVNESHLKFKPMQECAEDVELTPTANERTNVPEERSSRYSAGSVELENFESAAAQHNHLTDEYFSNFNNSSQEQNNDKDNNDDDDEEDYSVSVSAIMQRRASIRGYRNKRGSRCSRRASSPMDHVLDSMDARRRSSVYTSSSDEGTNQESTQEQIYENIRLHKEVIQSVKLQPWPIRKKLKLVRQAKTYVARHEGALQERFAMSRSTKDLFARFKILMAARWRHWKRETSSFLTVLIPWELRIKEIESHFGSGVASYFTFLRWLMWVNIMIAIPLVAFVIGPEYFATKHEETDPRKRMSKDEFKVAGNLFTIWEFEGFLKYSPMFYGYYSAISGASSLGYKLPLAYFLTAVVVYIYSFVAILRKMAENSRNSKLSSKDDECTFSWKLFTGWDFMIGHAETAHNRIASVVVGFKEALLEEAEKKKDKRNWRIIMQRILVNLLVMGLLAASGYTVVLLVDKSEDLAKQDNWLSRNAVNVTMTLISFFLPMIFEALGLFENWHPRQQLRLQLARIMILNMLNLYSLMFSFIYKINKKKDQLTELKKINESATREMHHIRALMKGLSTTVGLLGLSSTTPTSNTLITDEMGNSIGSTTDGGDTTTEGLFSTTAAALASTMGLVKCYNVTYNCSKQFKVSRAPTLATTMSLLLINFTTMIPPSTEPISTITTPPPELFVTTSTTPLAGDSTTNDDFWNTATPPNANSIDKLLTTLAPGSRTTRAGSEHPTDTTTQQTSSTALSAKVASFFDYYDYFAGMPLELDAEEDKDKARTKTVGTATRRFGRPTRTTARKPANLKQRKGHKFKRDTVGQTAAQLGEQREVTTPEIDTTKSPQEFTANQATPLTTAATQRAPEADSSGSSNATGNAVNHNYVDVNIDGISDDYDTTTTNSTELLQEVLAYFTTSTTTNSPPSTKPSITTMPPTTSDTTASAEPESATTPSYDSSWSTTPYFIKDEVIKEVGEPKIFNASEIDGDIFGMCVRTICDPVEVPTSSTPRMESTTDLATRSSLKPSEEHELRLALAQANLTEVQKNLTNMCWETSLGQELSKVIVFDGLMGIFAPFCIDFLRALFVRYVNQNWCWDMEKTFPQYGDFKIAENILTLIYNQGQVWMGIFFSPGLVLINLLKLIIMMYFRSWIVLTCNVPHEVVFKASKSNNFYLTLLLTMLFLCVLPVSYAIVWLEPSWHCGPFSNHDTIAEFITQTTKKVMPDLVNSILNYLTSASTVIPLLLLLILIIYYLISLTGALREANQDLRTQLQKEREEERRKMFKVPEPKPTEPQAATLTSRWRKVLEASSPVTPTSQPPDFETEEYKNQARKELISRIMKKALRKSSATSDDDSVVRHGRDDDDTDTEHHDSLPHDEEGKERVFGLSKLQQIRRTRKPSLVDIVQIAKSERERERKTSMGTGAAGGATATGAAANGTTAATKDTQPKSRFRVEKHERKEKDRERDKEKADETQQPVENEHDPDVNSRIVNERRESLLRRKREDDDRKKKEINSATREPTAEGEAKLRDQAAASEAHHRIQLKLPIKLKLRPEHLHTTAAAPGSKSSDPESTFVVVNEKQTAHESPSPRVSVFDKSKHFHDSIRLKFMKQRMKSPTPTTTSNEDGVFQFDENAFAKRAQTLGKPVKIPAIPATEHLRTETQTPHSSADEATPPRRAGSFKQANAEKLASLSRQGRKKIGSFVQLMREAAKKFEMEKLQQQQENGTRATSEPTTPIPTATGSTLPATTSTADKLDSSSLKIEIPQSSCEPTSQTETEPATASTNNAAEPLELGAVGGAMPTESKPKLAPIEALEERDQAGPITFPQRSLSQRRRKSAERLSAAAQRPDPPTSIWSDNIPTITISTTGSDECVAEPEALTPTTVKITKTTSKEITSTVATTPVVTKKVTRTAVTTPSPIPSRSASRSPSPAASSPTPSDSSNPKVNIIKINIENNK